MSYKRLTLSLKASKEDRQAYLRYDWRRVRNVV